MIVEGLAHSRLMMSLTTENEQDPQQSCEFGPIYYLIVGGIFLLVFLDFLFQN